MRLRLTQSLAVPASCPSMVTAVRFTAVLLTGVLLVGCQRRAGANLGPAPSKPTAAISSASASPGATAASPAVVSESSGVREDSETEEAPRPRQPIDFAVRDPEDDPALTDDYFGAVENGKSAEPPPRPTNLPGDRAFSIGPPNGGWLINGKPIELRGRWYRVLPGTAQRGWYFATEALIGMLHRASDVVGEKLGGSPLRVGNMSRREGGKITPSVSHQSGRDADIGIFATDLDGETVDPGGFPKFDGARGDAMIDTTGQYLFDVARNWAFVEALLRDPASRIQWIFLDTPLKEILLDYAVRTHVNAEVIGRAEKVIVRPSNSSPHANHFHIRIFCTQGDLEYGCKDMGPEWDWVEAARAVDQQMLDSIVDDVMTGRRQLDLFNPETGKPAPVDHDEPDGLRTPPIALPTGTLPTGTLPTGALPTGAPGPKPKPVSPDQLPDPPTHVELKPLR